MDIRKWSFETHEYEPCEIPDDAIICLYTTEMDMPINCTNCLRGMTFGQGYTSRQYHNTYGLGFPVCGKCYTNERKMEEASR